jgi:hypothetical protein
VEHDVVRCRIQNQHALGEKEDRIAVDRIDLQTHMSGEGWTAIQVNAAHFMEWA